MAVQVVQINKQRRETTKHIILISCKARFQLQIDRNLHQLLHYSNSKMEHCPQGQRNHNHATGSLHNGGDLNGKAMLIIIHQIPGNKVLEDTKTLPKIPLLKFQHIHKAT